MPPLLRLILIRLGLGVLTLFMVSLVVFLATQALPGDPARAVLGREAANTAQYEALRKQLRLDEPLPRQYVNWLSGVVTGDLGDSLASGSASLIGAESAGSEEGTPVTALLRDRVVNSSVLVLIAALISIPVAILIGALSALKRDSKFDTTTNIGNLALAALPEFVIGIGLVLLFATSVFEWFPAVSRIDPEIPLWNQLELFVLPAVTLALAVVPYISRMLRASMIEVLESEYIELARLKGLEEPLVLRRHALPNAMAPTIQVIALQLAWLAGGVVVVEYVFGFSGVGQALVEAVANRDIPTIQALCLGIAALYVILNLLADILTILISPRLRTGLR